MCEFLFLWIYKSRVHHRLRVLINKYGEANEDNEMFFDTDVSKLVSQIEVYDQIWYVRDKEFGGKHSRKSIELVRDFLRCWKIFRMDVRKLFRFRP